MKKHVFTTCLFWLSVLIIVSLVSCELETKYDYLHEISSIATIEIIEVGNILDGADDIEQKIICNINDVNQFINELSTIDCYALSSPQKIRNDSTVIKITYINGDYELIDALGQSKFINGIFYRSEGWYSFDEKQFEDFINKYAS